MADAEGRDEAVAGRDRDVFAPERRQSLPCSDEVPALRFDVAQRCEQFLQAAAFTGAKALQELELHDAAESDAILVQKTADTVAYGTLGMPEIVDPGRGIDHHVSHEATPRDIDLEGIEGVRYIPKRA